MSGYKEKTLFCVCNSQLEFFYCSRVQFLTSGAASKAWRGDIKERDREGLQFFYDGQGFMSVELNQTEVQIVFYDVFGEVLHKWSTKKELLSSI